MGGGGNRVKLVDISYLYMHNTIDDGLMHAKELKRNMK